MGFEDRDYYRDPEWQPERGDHSAVRWLVVICVVVFIGQMIDDRLTGWLSLTTDGTLPKWQLWRLLTHAFCHSRQDLSHLFLNMFGLWFLGKAVQERLGNREFIAFYLVAAVTAGLCFLGFEGLLHERAVAVGASGAVMGVLALYALWYPRQQFLVMFVLPVEARWLVAGFVIYDTVPAWRALMGHEVVDGVAHAAHLGGLLFGFAYHIFEWRLSNWLSFGRVPAWWRDRERRKAVRLYSPESEGGDSPEGSDLDAKVDDILRKIHEHGETSLSDRERLLLSEASRRYRERTTRTP
jgi:membrane associated rhomboid family serine protease